MANLNNKDDLIRIIKSNHFTVDQCNQIRSIIGIVQNTTEPNAQNIDMNCDNAVISVKPENNIIKSCLCIRL